MRALLVRSCWVPVYYAQYQKTVPKAIMDMFSITLLKGVRKGPALSFRGIRSLCKLQRKEGILTNFDYGGACGLVKGGEALNTSFYRLRQPSSSATASTIVVVVFFSSLAVGQQWLWCLKPLEEVKKEPYSSLLSLTRWPDLMAVKPYQQANQEIVTSTVDRCRSRFLWYTIVQTLDLEKGATTSKGGPHRGTTGAKSNVERGEAS
ncbi:hypothetical protein RHMOL_Rhmol11G0090100 [Rhododendron molle]|uniref:Uncharacterized protein n=1 Tax=Rhododendron molle TaxID=49168 RepID=A0ACC0LR52_RHOML|nr:hypothetical protein RHMOL_Rhmol11G0090100 [Rhododendron molle]